MAARGTSHGSSYGQGSYGQGSRRSAEPGREQGIAVLEDLLRRPPADVASWALDQARELSQPNVNVDQLPIFKLAGALKTVPVDKKQALVQSAVSGFGDLPVHRRAEAVRLAMRSHDIMAQADSLEITQMAQREHAAAMQRLQALEQRQAQMNGSSSKNNMIDTNSQMMSSQQHAEPFPAHEPLVENLLRVAKEARFNEMPPDELRHMAQAARGEAHTLMQPQQLLDVVSELNPGEREQLTEALVEARVVPEEQRGVLEEAVRPGGYADKLGGALALAARAREYAWVFIVLPISEFVLALILDHFGCGTPLVGWLRFDSLLALCVAGSVYFIGHTFAPLYVKLKEDPVGAVQRWQSVAEVRSWKVKLETAVPGVEFDTYRAGGAGLAVLVVLILIGAIWAIIGVLELLATAFLGCNFVTTLFSFIFISIRFGCLVGMMWSIYYVLDEIQRHRSRSPMLGSSLIPMSEDAMPRDPQFHQGMQSSQGHYSQGHYSQGQYYQQGPRIS